MAPIIQALIQNALIATHGPRGWLPCPPLVRLGGLLCLPMLLLASASPARRRLLEQAAIPFSWQVSGVDEQAIQSPDPEQLVLRLAEAKAEAVLAARGWDNSWQLGSASGPRASRRDRLPGAMGAGGEASLGAANVAGAGESATILAVLGCDSLLSLAGETFGKPADAEQARQRWRRLAGGRAQLLTGHCLIWPGGRRSATVATSLQFAALSPEEIDRYVASGEPLACAGGFALEGLGGMVVERLEGCWSNVIGLSLPLLRQWLTPLGGSPLSAATTVAAQEREAGNQVAFRQAGLE
jgi:septum formation protein